MLTVGKGHSLNRNISGRLIHSRQLSWRRQRANIVSEKEISSKDNLTVYIDLTQELQS